MEIVYSAHRIETGPGQVYRNPRLFVTVEADASKVIIYGHHPKIAAAYRKAGVPVEVIEPKPVGFIPATVLCGSEDDMPDIPDGWRDLAWPELRALAKQCGAPFAINRDQAMAAIGAEVERQKLYDAYVDEPPLIQP